MKPSTQYREFADECDRLAKETSDPRHKKVLEEMGRAWRELADEADQKNAG
jgi:hypothetical protein